MTKIQEEVMESAQLTDTQEERLRNEEHQMSEMLHHLAPWIEKTDGEEVFGDWMQTLPVTMMMKLLGLWLTEESRHRLRKMLEFYHPVDRAAMVYALLVYVMTGTKMVFKSAVAKQHYKTTCKMLKEDMPQLPFAGHMKYMMRRYGKNKKG